RDSRTRQHEELVANYIQRYCVKNDTIGFFGPVGWARLEAQDDNLRVGPGAGLVAERNLYFETWCIDAVAEALSKEKSLRMWLAPQLMPFIRVEGFSLYIPARGAIRLSPQQKALIEKCDGQRTAKQIADELTGGSAAGFKSETEVFNLLEALHNKAVISWKLEAPMDLYPELYIRKAIERVEDVQLRKKALAVFDELENARAIVAQSAGDADKLDSAMDNLEAIFTRVTGSAPTRSAGRTYAGRTLLYEDCRRDATVGIGP